MKQIILKKPLLITWEVHNTTKTRYNLLGQFKTKWSGKSLRVFVFFIFVLIDFEIILIKRFVPFLFFFCLFVCFSVYEVYVKEETEDNNARDDLPIIPSLSSSNDHQLIQVNDYLLTIDWISRNSIFSL